MNVCWLLFLLTLLAVLAHLNQCFKTRLIFQNHLHTTQGRNYQSISVASGVYNVQEKRQLHDGQIFQRIRKIRQPGVYDQVIDIFDNVEDFQSIPIIISQTSNFFRKNELKEFIRDLVANNFKIQLPRYHSQVTLDGIAITSLMTSCNR